MYIYEGARRPGLAEHRHAVSAGAYLAYVIAINIIISSSSSSSSISNSDSNSNIMFCYYYDVLLLLLLILLLVVLLLLLYGLLLFLNEALIRDVNSAKRTERVIQAAVRSPSW